MAHSSHLVLASSSPYRRELLDRLGLEFEVRAPDIDESQLDEESPATLVRRLAQAKARAVARIETAVHDPAPARPELVIGSDQVAVLDGHILGKPGSLQANIEQLRAASGREVRFLTGLCLLDTRDGAMLTEVIPFTVRFATLRDAQIERYVALEPALDCAGGFKCEGLGVALFAEMTGPDATALVGLPLLELVRMLRSRGMDPLA